MFIDWEAIYKDERLNGKIFFMFAGVSFHFFLTFWMVGYIISHLNGLGVYILMIWIVIFKFGISLIAANVNFWVSDVSIYKKYSNSIEG